jgi:hypothetical protein
MVDLWGPEYEQWNMPEPATWEGYYLTDDIISAHKDLTDRIVDVGFVEEDWEEQVSFAQVEELK